MEFDGTCYVHQITESVSFAAERLCFLVWVGKFNFGGVVYQKRNTQGRTPNNVGFKNIYFTPQRKRYFS
jgi:hypothetical protein